MNRLDFKLENLHHSRRGGETTPGRRTVEVRLGGNDRWAKFKAPPDPAVRQRVGFKVARRRHQDENPMIIINYIQ